MRRIVGLVGFLLVTQWFIGCGAQDPRDKVFNVSDSDQRMNTAIKQARDTVKVFIESLQTPQPGQSDHSVKMGFDDGKHTEHIWVVDVTYDGHQFQGTIGNDVVLVSNVKLGEVVKVPPEQISDWMYVQNGQLVGGYTLRVLRDSLSPSEREKFDQSVPFIIK